MGAREITPEQLAQIVAAKKEAATKLKLLTRGLKGVVAKVEAAVAPVVAAAVVAEVAVEAADQAVSAEVPVDAVAEEAAAPAAPAPVSGKNPFKKKP